ncbi:hypothetical protein B8W96_10520 [Lentilactobacillus parakefiri]|uniref:Uncharacterized protein n=1 Tax=Lentilactobacillus parakefiri TaxID=152332 RepID=A0A269YRS2_9LACO|nr:hypothetical protein B8W98_01770 [Lentilactobacillus parakefiri]PAK99653.1 hypothetical protein B8W96_10520 [Lentilactobacillus parakefiri]
MPTQVKIPQLQITMALAHLQEKAVILLKIMMVIPHLMNKVIAIHPNLLQMNQISQQRLWRLGKSKMAKQYQKIKQTLHYLLELLLTLILLKSASLK